MSAPPPAIRACLWLGVAALVLDFALTYAIAAAHTDYSHTAQYMSELAVPGEPYARLLSGWWIVYGVLVIAFAVAVRAGLARGGLALVVAPALLALAGAGLGIGGGWFPCDAGCAGVTASGQAHAFAGFGGSLALVAAPFAFAISTRRDPSARRLSRSALAFGVVGAGLFALFLAAGAPEGALSPYRGGLQRAFLAFYYVWLGLLATQVLRASRADLR